MRRFRNLSTMTKLMIGFGLMGLIMAGIGYKGAAGISEMNDLLDTLYERDMVGLSAVKEANIDLLNIARALRQAIIVTSQDDMERARQEVEKADAELRQNLAKYEKTVVSAEARAKLADVQKIYAEYIALARKILGQAVAGQKNEAISGLMAARGLGDNAVAAFTELGASNEQRAKQAFDDRDVIYFAARKVLWVVIGAGIAFGLALGYFIARLISQALAKVKQITEQAASGDLTARVQVDSKDELGAIGLALNGMLDSFHASMSEVRRASDHAAAASQQLAAGSEQLSSGAQEQASSLEETAASLEEITGSAKQNADNAKQASQLAVGSRDAAEKGGQVVTAAVSAMQEINRASKKIADIITTIDEIAFQTNLLALNAAVEAARAGEQGRGFSVVAAEVRNLAQRSATAAKEIKGLIEDSLGKVEAGSELVNRSGETLSEIVGSVKRVTDIIGEIAAASQEQTSGIEQVNRAVTQMDQVVQSNASQTEELSATAQALAGQAEQLQQLVARFTLDGGGRTSATLGSGPVLYRAPVSRALTPVARAKAASAPRVRQSRKTDVPVLAAAPAANGKTHHADDGFEEF